MTNAYSELYLDDAMQNLGDMVEYAVCDCGYDPDEFFGWFISSGIASKFEKGNPKYITGMSGFELAEAVLKATNIALPGVAPSHPDFKGREYWAGWIFAYYQWQSGRRFEDIVADGLTLSTVFSMYIHHEADNSKFVESADAIIRRNKEARKSKLHTIRKARGFTQQQLSEAAGVALRMVQLYEQKQNDLSKAQAGVVISLAKVLGCEVEDLID
ncbi:MAG: helix-turn-helix transcriptional regulator [Clostridiales bacterium]|nr:helix-turn-helix transcriptional regulator [Clostridiales bacterium]